MEIHMKKCSSCNEIKDYFFFHKDKNTKTGCTTYCKICKNIKDKAYAKTYVISKEIKDRKTNWRKSFPERKNAHSKVYRAMKNGVLVRQPCFICGDKSEAHHPDYSRPLDVVWLCPPHHRQAHNNV
jgi:hypothetical protein